MPPFTRRQRDLARAVRHGFKPTRSAKGFSRQFAEQVKVETNEEAAAASKRRKHVTR